LRSTSKFSIQLIVSRSTIGSTEVGQHHRHRAWATASKGLRGWPPSAPRPSLSGSVTAVRLGQHQAQGQEAGHHWLHVRHLRHRHCTSKRGTANDAQAPSSTPPPARHCPSKQGTANDAEAPSSTPPPLLSCEQAREQPMMPRHCCPPRCRLVIAPASEGQPTMPRHCCLPHCQLVIAPASEGRLPMPRHCCPPRHCRRRASK
jgi:hypothetical protein